MKLKLSDQAIGAIMMALQKSLMEQSDIVPVLKGFELEQLNNQEVIIINPPMIKIDKKTEELEQLEHLQNG